MRRFTRPEWYRKNGAVIGYVVLSAAVTVAIIGVILLALDGRRSHDAVCALRADLRTRVKSGEQFLKTHPQGIPGISRADIVRSLQGQRDTIDALGVADC